MNYDNWKLATPDTEDIVSTCCGAEIQEEDMYDEYCYTAYVCTDCGDECEEINHNEYIMNQAEYWKELNRNE